MKIIAFINFISENYCNYYVDCLRWAVIGTVVIETAKYVSVVILNITTLRKLLDQ